MRQGTPHLHFLSLHFTSLHFNSTPTQQLQLNNSNSTTPTQQLQLNNSNSTTPTQQLQLNNSNSTTQLQLNSNSTPTQLQLNSIQFNSHHFSFLFDIENILQFYTCEKSQQRGFFIFTKCLSLKHVRAFELKCFVF